MRKYTCLQLTDTHLNLIVLHRRSGGYTRLRDASLPLPEPARPPMSHPAFVGTLGQLLAENKRCKLYLSIASDAVLVKSIQLPTPIPDVSASLQRQAIETTLETENHIPIPLDSAAYDYHLSSPTSLAVGWTRKHSLQAVMTALRATGVELVCLTPQPVLLAQQLIAQCNRPERVCGVYLQTGVCDLAVVEGTDIYGARSFKVQAPDALWQAVRQTVENCPNPNDTPLTRIILFQAGSRDGAPEPVPKIPAGVFECEITSAPFDWAETLITPIDSGHGMRLNLLKPLLLKHRQHRKQLIKRRVWQAVPIAIVFLLIWANFYLFRAIESKQHRVDQLRAVQAKTERLQHKNESLKRELGAVSTALAQLAWAERKYPALSARLTGVAKSIPPTVQLKEIHTLPPPRKPSKDFDTRKTLRLIGLAPAQPEIDAFRVTLLRRGAFASVQQVKTEPTLIKGERGLEFTLLLTAVEEGDTR